MASERDYDLVVLGANGYTGQHAVEHIYKDVRTDLKWAVAGRSSPKLMETVDRMQNAYPGRRHPAIEILQLNHQELGALARKTRVILNAVGPYHIHSTPVVEACAANGTHYVDVTGETPWVYDIMSKYHDTARTNEAVIIPSVGLESLPTDLLAYLLACHFRKTFNTDLKHAFSTIHKLRSGGFSGGTLATAITLFENYSISQIIKTFDNPYCLSPSTPTRPTPSRRPFLSRLFGPFSVPHLGMLTTSVTAKTNVAIAQRSAGLLRSLYGPSFYLEEYYTVRHRIMAFVLHLVWTIGPVFLFIPGIPFLLKRIVTQPGFGPSETQNENSQFDMRALGAADPPGQPQTSAKNYKRPEVKAFARFTYDKHIYEMSGVLMVECALAILSGEQAVKRRFEGGGLLTPACLAETTDLMDRLKKAGFGLEVEEVRDS